MAISPVNKALLGFLGVGTAGGTVAAGYKLSQQGDKKDGDASVVTKSKTLIRELLNGDKTKKLLSTDLGSQDSYWMAAFEKYRTGDSSKDANPWGISSWEKIKSQTGQAAPQEFLDKCDKESQKEVEDSSDQAYINVSTWCTREATDSES
ncbi:hypothetical protein MHF_1329 [Mycoplasma haemofelis Ohio2]|uniref:Uncharacterized protein n=1 Tax=Mycoplasma haemofelis (strain Ohio2) TaxID=859194 RepID=F6FG67_MYCHI|nr:hypothetical protein MHF_1329 [Mycoplasma haemofelis Ohio2]